MTDIRAIAQTALDTALNGAVYVFWQRKAEIANDPNPSEYIVYTLGGDYNRKFADNVPIAKEADVTVRYYYKYEKLDTSAGRALVKAREETLLTALKGAGFSSLGGFFDSGDIDEVGCFTSVAECNYKRVV